MGVRITSIIVLIQIVSYYIGHSKTFCNNYENLSLQIWALSVMSATKFWYQILAKTLLVKLSKIH